jgi:hypothetical protein
LPRLYARARGSTGALEAISQSRDDATAEHDEHDDTMITMGPECFFVFIVAIVAIATTAVGAFRLVSVETASRVPSALA